jgi:hypothetical protein
MFYPMLDKSDRPPSINKRRVSGAQVSATGLPRNTPAYRSRTRVATMNTAQRQDRVIEAGFRCVHFDRQETWQANSE